MEDEQTKEKRTEFECDFNDFHCSKYDIDIEDVKGNPSAYINYKPESVPESEQRLRDIENALAELGDILGGE